MLDPDAGAPALRSQGTERAVRGATDQWGRRRLAGAIGSHPMRTRNLLLAVALLQLACATAPPPPERAPAPDARPGDPPLLEERALLLLLEDRKLFEAVVVARFEQGGPELREL